MYKLDSKKAENQKSNCQHLLDHRKSKRVPENIYFCFTDYTKIFDCVNHNKLWKILKQMKHETTLLTFWETCIQHKKQQLQPNMKQQTGSKLGKEYIRAVCYHPAYLTYTQSKVRWSHSVMSNSVIPWTVAYQAIPSMGFSRLEYWSGLPFPHDILRVHHEKCWAVGSTNWNQDCQEKYQ